MVPSSRSRADVFSHFAVRMRCLKHSSPAPRFNTTQLAFSRHSRYIQHMHCDRRPSSTSFPFSLIVRSYSDSGDPGDADLLFSSFPFLLSLPQSREPSPSAEMSHCRSKMTSGGRRPLYNPSTRLENDMQGEGAWARPLDGDQLQTKRKTSIPPKSRSRQPSQDSIRRRLTTTSQLP